MRPAVVTGMAYLAGSIPFSNLVARRVRNVDLRTVGGGTVSGTSLYELAGFGPLAAAGICDLAKGALGPALAGRDRPALAAVAAGAAVAGHDWSPFLRGAGGRGIAPAVGAMLVTGWSGAAILLGGNLAGRVVGQTGLGGFGAIVVLPPAMARLHGRRAAFVAAGVAVPMLLKRITGNRPPAGPRGRAYLTRLVLDRDPGDMQTTT